jgi:hypothetical protein
MHGLRKRLTVAVVVVAAGLSASTSATAGTSQCTFSGPKWSEGASTGTTYNLELQNVSCGYATPWARKLAAKPNKAYASVKGGPAGWNCSSMAPGPKVTSGACVKGTKRFGWSAAV